jgi:hypothetical protein
MSIITADLDKPRRIESGVYDFLGHRIERTAYMYWAALHCEASPWWNEYWEGGGHAGFAPRWTGDSLTEVATFMRDGMTAGEECGCTEYTRSQYIPSIIRDWESVAHPND